MAQNSVLLVDDDVKITKLLESYFAQEGFVVKKAHDGSEALKSIIETKPDIVVLDLMLPAMDGLEICRQVRKKSDIPILMLTARDEEADRLIGLELGADDYVAKPFSPREVVARARAILRRTQQTASNKQRFIKAGNISIDIFGHEALLDGKALDLTPTEFKILELLASNAGRVFTRLQIVEYVQDYAFDGYERTIDAHVKNLRRKLGDNPKEPQIIQTVYGVGYKFAGDGRA